MVGKHYSWNQVAPVVTVVIDKLAEGIFELKWSVTATIYLLPFLFPAKDQLSQSQQDYTLEGTVMG